MICHICHEPASGQCKSCLRFYCPRHGDLTCVECAHVTAEPPPAPAPSPVEPESDALPSIVLPGPHVQGGPTCYACTQPATRACRRCGQFYCEEHGPRFFLWGNQCQGCDSSGCIMSVVGLVFAGIVLLVLIASNMR